jgi:hypothetical protein
VLSEILVIDILMHDSNSSVEKRILSVKEGEECSFWLLMLWYYSVPPIFDGSLGFNKN